MSSVPDIDVAQPGAAAAATSGAASGETREVTSRATGARVDWFPTSIWRFNVAGHQALNERLMRFIEAERRRDPSGMSGRSNVMGDGERQDGVGGRSLPSQCVSERRLLREHD